MMTLGGRNSNGVTFSPHHCQSAGLLQDRLLQSDSVGGFLFFHLSLLLHHFITSVIYLLVILI